MTPPAALIVNGRSRRGRAWFKQAHDQLLSAGVPLRQTTLLKKGMDLSHEIENATQKGCRSVLIGGGDGTLRAAAKELAGTDLTLGVLPFGTGNAFARDLGIETDIAAAVEVIRIGHQIQTDVGYAGEEPFLNVASVGLSALVATNLKRMPKALLGPLAYIIPLLRALRFISPFEAEIELCSGTQRLNAYQIVVGNGRYHAGPFLLAENAGLQTGKLVVYALNAKNKAVLYRYAIALLLGRQQDFSDLEIWETGHCALRTDPARNLVLDGDLLGKTPVEFSCRHGTLKVFAPQNDPND